MYSSNVSDTITTPDVSVVVCTYNRAHLLEQTLNSLLSQDTRGRSFEVVVVDDGSTDATRRVAETIAPTVCVCVRYIRQGNAGVGAARNRGIQEARAPWIAFIDDDEIASEHWLDELLSTAEKTGADCVGGPCLLKPLPGAVIEPVGTIRMLLSENPAVSRTPRSQTLLERIRNRATRLELPGGGNALVKRALLEKLGGFRTIRYGEDLDIFRRAREAGAVIVIAHGAVVHHLMPPDRLTEAYLTSLAASGGKTQAEIDLQRANTLRPYFMVVLRSAHQILINIPAWLWHRATGHMSYAVSRKCSYLFALAYVQEVSATGVLRLNAAIRRKGEHRA